MKKNIISALTILLTLVATLNLTSCEKIYFENDASGSFLKSEDLNRGSNFSKGVMNVTFDRNVKADSLREEAAILVQDYLQENLGDLAESIFVSPDFKSVSITTKKCQNDAIEAKLMEMTNNGSTAMLSDQIRTNLPQLQSLNLSIRHNCRNTSFFNFHYSRNSK